MAITVTLNLSDYTPLSSGGCVKFDLVGQGNDTPRTTDAMLTSATVKATADADGMVSQVLIGNDDIVPSGTSYQLTAFNNEGGWVFTKRYCLKGGGTVDLSTLTEL